MASVLHGSAPSPYGPALVSIRRQASFLQSALPPLLRSNIAPGLNRSGFTILRCHPICPLLRAVQLRVRRQLPLLAHLVRSAYGRFLAVPVRSYGPSRTRAWGRTNAFAAVVGTAAPCAIQCSTHPRVGSWSRLSATKQIPIVPEGGKLFEESPGSDQTNRRACRGALFRWPTTEHALNPREVAPRDGVVNLSER